MITFRSGDIFAAKVDALVNPVNCVGVMGGGLALAFRHAFPPNYEAYLLACERQEVQPGRMFVTKRSEDPRWLINFPTKRHWRDPSRIEDVETGLTDLRRVLMEEHIGSIAMPALGCGLGGLDWDEVRPCIETALGDISGLRAVVFEPR